MTTVQFKQSELEGSIATLARLYEYDVDALLSRFVEGYNTALAKSDLTLHRKFTLIERGLRRLTEHADKTRRQLKRAADRIIRRERAR